MRWYGWAAIAAVTVTVAAMKMPTIVHTTNKMFAHGTMIGMARCVEWTPGVGVSLSEKAAHKKCAQEFSRAVFIDVDVRGRVVSAVGGLNFAIQAENLTTDHVLTAVEIVVVYRKSATEEDELRHQYGDLWIEPGQKGVAEAVLRTDWQLPIDKPWWCDERDDPKTAANCIEFGFVGAESLRI